MTRPNQKSRLNRILDWNWIELNESFGRICSYKFHINVHEGMWMYFTCTVRLICDVSLYLFETFIQKSKILIKITRIEDEQVKFCQNDIIFDILAIWYCSSWINPKQDPRRSHWCCMTGQFWRILNSTLGY